MGLLDGILGSVLGGGSGGIGGAASNMVIDAIATKFGIPPAMAEMAVAALSKAHPEPGDTVAAAAQHTGIDSSVLSGIVGHLGGDSALGQIAEQVNGHPEIGNILGQLTGGSGGGLGGLADLASGLLGGKK